jgi:hypothetical protein
VKGIGNCRHVTGLEVVDDGKDESPSTGRQAVDRGYNFSSMRRKQALDVASKINYFL